jgi:hypothetical protein
MAGRRLDGPSGKSMPHEKKASRSPDEAFNFDTYVRFGSQFRRRQRKGEETNDNSRDQFDIL